MDPSIVMRVLLFSARIFEKGDRDETLFQKNGSI